MSEESGFGLNLAEKFFGLIILLTGILALYFTASSVDALAAYAGLFGFLCFILIALGLVLLIAKTE
jgi:amino acid transporter